MRWAALAGLVMAMAGVGYASSGARSQAGRDPAVLIRVRIGSPEIAPRKELTRAERVAGDILGKAGIQVEWVECRHGEGENPCLLGAGPGEFWVHLVGRRPASFHGDVAGFAVLIPPWENADPYAGIWYPEVEEAARHLEAETYYMLGATLAHEIGHILLGAKAHSSNGIMVPRIRREQLVLLQRGELVFTPDQAARAQRRLNQFITLNRNDLGK